MHDGQTKVTHERFTYLFLFFFGSSILFPFLRSIFREIIDDTMWLMRTKMIRQEPRLLSDGVSAALRDRQATWPSKSNLAKLT